MNRKLESQHADQGKVCGARSKNCTVMPRLHVLSKRQMMTVHDESKRLLGTVGVRIEPGLGIELMRKAGANPDGNGVVKLSPQLVEWAIKTAPAVIRIYNRRGKPAFVIGKSRKARTRFGIGCTNLYYQQPEDDRVVPIRREHIRQAVQLGNHLSEMDIVSTIGIPREISPDKADLYSALEMIANTEKPLVVLVPQDSAFSKVIALFEYLHGDVGKKPFIIPYFNPVTPLVINAETVNKMALATSKGLPFIYSNYGMYGATTPIMEASTLALLNAELLAGLVLSQLMKEGTPVILGSLPAGFDMRTMSSTYCPTTLLLNIACAEMMNYYGIPHAGTSGSGPGWGPDLIACSTLLMNHLTAMMGCAGMAPFIGGNFDSTAFSPPMVVLANQLIKDARLFANGFTMDESSFGIADILQVGIGGNFLSSDQTIARFAEKRYENDIWPNLTLDAWQQKGQPRAEAVLREHTCALLARLAPPEDHQSLLEKGEAYISRKVE